MGTLLREAGALPQDRARTDRERLQGTWNFVSGTREAQLVIAGADFTIRFKNGETYAGTYDLDPAQRPRAVDMRIARGPERHQGKVALGIYALDGDHLIWSPGTPGEDARPRFFPSRDDRARMCIVFRREKPPRT